MWNNHKITIYFLLGICLSCQNRPATHVTQNKVDNAVRKVQTNDSSIITCKSVIVFQNSIHNIAAITEGKILKIAVLPGEFVNKGETIATIESATLLALQQEYLENKNRADYFREDFKRQGLLTLEDAASIKTLQKAQAEFAQLEVRLAGQKKQLSLAGIDADQLTIENLQTQYIIKSSVSGYINTVEANNGNYLHTGDVLCSMFIPAEPELRLLIPDKWYNQIKKGQTVKFVPAQNAHDTCYAKISRCAKWNIAQSNLFEAWATPILKWPALPNGYEVDAFLLKE
jgi:multidrug efflux pump subunit AcrA (membrane-fusion protein)